MPVLQSRGYCNDCYHRIALALQAGGAVCVSLYENSAAAAIVKTLCIGTIANMSCCATTTAATTASTKITRYC